MPCPVRSGSDCRRLCLTYSVLCTLPTSVTSSCHLHRYARSIMSPRAGNACDVHCTPRDKYDPRVRCLRSRPRQLADNLQPARFDNSKISQASHRCPLGEFLIRRGVTLPNGGHPAANGSCKLVTDSCSLSLFHLSIWPPTSFLFPIPPCLLPLLLLFFSLPF